MPNSSNPTSALLATMREHGLEPPDIQWDGEIHRFPGIDAGSRSDTSGWYVAYPDPPEGAAFGDWRTGLKQTWSNTNGRPDDFDADAWRERIETQRAEREAELREQQAEVAAECRERWDAAEPASLEHSYLQSKGVTRLEDGWLRQDGDTLLVPMRATEAGNPIVSLQTISPAGEKLFTPGGQAGSTRTMLIDSDQPGGPVYLTEGWATGWSIHEVTGSPVVVAFFAANLTPIAEYLRERNPKVELVVCADNDRWTEHHTGEPNPGVVEARRAAEAADAEFAVPDFQDTSSHPTDFNDLHQLEGPEAVAAWLEPSRAPEAVTVHVTDEPGASEESDESGAPDDEEPPPEPPEDEPPKPPKEPEWISNAPFRMLGHDHGTYYYMPEETGQLTSLTVSQHERKAHLCTIAPMSWWEAHFPANNGVSWTTAMATLLQAQHRVGIFQPDRIRGRGCWFEPTEAGDEGILVHLGDRLVVPGERSFVVAEDYVSPGGYTYEVMARKDGPSLDPLSMEESAEILDLSRSFLWNEDASGDMLAGWITLAPLCGALEWRPHIWLVGERGSGKTWLLEHFITPLLADMHLFVQGETTEAGIRQSLKSDAFPVIFDEAEEGEGVGTRVQRVLALARQASSETQARTLKGTVSGSSLDYRIRSMFCLASIGGAVHQESDKSRINLLALKGASQVDPDFRQKHWERIQPRAEAVDRAMGRRLIARTLGQMRSGMLRDTIKTFRREAAAVLGDQRLGDQYGTLYAGAWALQAEDAPTAQVARAQIDSERLEAYQEDQLPEGVKALQALLQQRERVEKSDGGAVTLSIGELIDVARGEIAPVKKKDAERVLGQAGFKIDVDDGAHVVYVANSSEWIKKALAGTMYARSIRNVLRSLPKVEPGGVTRFSPGFSARSTMIPYSVIREGGQS